MVLFGPLTAMYRTDKVVQFIVFGANSPLARDETQPTCHVEHESLLSMSQACAHSNSVELRKITRMRGICFPIDQSDLAERNYRVSQS